MGNDGAPISPARPNLLGLAFVALADRVPALRHRLWRWWYDALARRDDQGDLMLMNFGYAPDTNGRINLEPTEEPYRYPLQLYHFVVSRLDLHDRDVLEVGSGRGGGAAWLARNFRPRSMLGVDLSPQAIARARAVHRVAGLSFEVGAAELLPCADASKDVVVNVESSHCYADMERFSSEVARVLRPGGYFTFCDLRTPGMIDKLHSLFVSTGLVLMHEEVISREVTRALDAVAEQRRTAIGAQVPQGFRGVMRDFSGVPGSVLYNLLRNGRLQYIHYLMQKPPVAGS